MIITYITLQDASIPSILHGLDTPRVPTDPESRMIFRVDLARAVQAVTDADKSPSENENRLVECWSAYLDRRELRGQVADATYRRDLEIHLLEHGEGDALRLANLEESVYILTKRLNSARKTFDRLRKGKVYDRLLGVFRGALEERGLI